MGNSALPTPPLVGDRITTASDSEWSASLRTNYSKLHYDPRSFDQPVWVPSPIWGRRPDFCYWWFGSRYIDSRRTPQKDLLPKVLLLLLVHIHCQGDVFTEPLPSSGRLLCGYVIPAFSRYIIILFLKKT
jgi:hypothetical protein